MKKRVLSMLLAIVMVFGLLPMGAMAAEGGYPDAEWYNFRNSAVNMGITSAVTPKSADYTQIKWTSTFGEYIGVPIIVGGYMYIAAGSAADNSYLYKLSLADGSVVKKSALALAFSSNNCNVAPTYVQEKGLIIVPLTEGVIQAFNIADMSSAWVYQDKPEATVAGAKTNPKGLGGQCQTPLVYADGKLYGGFYVSTNANFVCLDAATGALQWYYPSKGGFYWTGAVAVGDYIVAGSEKGNGNLLMFSKTNTPADAADPIAEPKSSLALNNAEGTSLGNQRSSMAYDAANGRVYFTSAAGYICSAKVDTASGELSDLKSFQEPNCTASTNTPIVYGDYVYYGAGKYGGYYFIVANKTTLETVAKVKILGNPQGSFLLSTAYAAEESLLYFYGTYNAKPGGVTLIKVPTTNPTSDTLVLEELYDARGFEEYCINSPICTADGTIYYRNDSKTIFALAKAEVEVPVFSTDLDSAQVKYGKDASAEPLSVTASITDENGSLSYQWQSSTDGAAWTDIAGATETSYTPSTSEVGTTYYRCVVTNTVEGKTASATSTVAEILVKVLSTNVNVNILANTANKLDGGVAGTVTTVGGNKIAYVENFAGTFKYIALGAADDGSFEPIKTNLTLYQGVASSKTPPTASNVSNSELYTRRYTTSNFKLPYVAAVQVTAEDGFTKETVYIVVDDGALGCYTLGVTGFTTDSAERYNAETGISFSATDQTVTLTPVTTTIGSGDEDKTNWAWTSSNPSVATVDANGTVKCIGGGEATITFSCDQIKKECKVISTAAKHLHSYTEGVCTICNTKEPAAVSAYFSIVKDGDFLVSKDGTTELYKAAISVTDADFDGTITLNDAFIAAHTDHSANGVADFVTEESSYGPFITKLWGYENSSVGYYLNNASANGLNVELKKNDVITAFFYKDTNGYSDLYTYVSGQTKVAATNETTYTVNGVANGATVVPKGATVKVYDSTNAEVTAMATTAGNDGTFTLSFAEAGTYTVEVSGTAAYTGSVWDYETNTSVSTDFSAAPVVPSRITVEVMPYVEKTVYVSISTKSGEFAVGKGGEVMHYFPVTATDNAANPDGNVTIAEVLEAAHAQYHADGISAIAGHKSNYVTKLWGESNGGNASYYFNDLYMGGGGGTKTGSNGREFKDNLLATVTENNDHIFIYSFQATDWTKGDLYTYFYPVTDTAVAGTEKSFTVKSATGYGTNANKLEGSLVKVTDANGVEQTALATNVREDGSFTITFPKAGTYTVDVRTNGTNYVTPARCTVTVSAPYIPPVEDDDISVYVTILGDTVHGADGDTHTYKAGNLETWLTRTEYSVDADSVVWDVLASAITGNGMSYSNPDGNYLESITKAGVTLSEFSNGSYSGWKYLLNGEYSNLGVNEQGLSDGDEIILHYTDDYTLDDDGNWTEPDVPSAPSNPDDTDKPEDNDKPTGETKVFVDLVEGAWYCEAIDFVVAQGIMNGVSEDKFDPSGTTTRAMIWTMLARLDGEDTSAGEKWYEAGQDWAIKNGVSDGSEPMGEVTREQLVTMLWRHMGEPESKGSLDSFGDSDKISPWAKDAMCWAVEQGLIKGVGNDLLAPKGEAGRAQVAQLFMNFMALTAGK